MDGWIMFARTLFWVVILALAWYVLYRYFQAQEDREKAARRRLVIVNLKDQSARLQRSVARQLQRTATQQKPIAIMQNDNNEALRVVRAEAIVALMEVFPEVTQTKAIKAVFGVAPSSTSKEYQAIVSAIKAAQAKQQQLAKYPPLTEQERSFRRAAKLTV